MNARSQPMTSTCARPFRAARRIGLTFIFAGFWTLFTPLAGSGQVIYGVFVDSWRTYLGESRIVGTNLGVGLVFQGDEGEYNRLEQRGALAFFFLNVDNTDPAGGLGEAIPKYVIGSWVIAANLFEPWQVELDQRRFNPRVGVGVGAVGAAAGGIGASPILHGGLRIRTSEGRGVLLEAQYWLTGGAPRTEFSVAMGALP